MALTYTIAKTAGGRADDFRALKFRARILTPAGTYITGGDVITAKSVGLKRIIAAIPLNGVAAATDGATANLTGAKVSADGTSVTLFVYECAATGLPFLEKSNAEAPITGQAFPYLFIGW